MEHLWSRTVLFDSLLGAYWVEVITPGAMLRTQFLKHLRSPSPKMQGVPGFPKEDEGRRAPMWTAHLPGRTFARCAWKRWRFVSCVLLFRHMIHSMIHMVIKLVGGLALVYSMSRPSRDFFWYVGMEVFSLGRGSQGRRIWTVWIYMG